MKQHVTDEGDPRNYWTQIPNIVFDIGLKPLELALYAHLKRAAGANANGKCFKSTATLARETGMGAGTVSRTKTALESKFAALGNRPLIRTKEISNPRGGKPFQEITITDIWKTNTDRFSSSSVEVDYQEASSSVEGGSQNQVPVEVDPSSKPISSVEIKKNSKEEHKKEEHKKEEQVVDFFADLRTSPFYSHVNFDYEIDSMRRWLKDHPARRMTRRFALNWIAKVERPLALPAEPSHVASVHSESRRADETKEEWQARLEAKYGTRKSA